MGEKNYNFQKFGRVHEFFKDKKQTKTYFQSLNLY